MYAQHGHHSGCWNSDSKLNDDQQYALLKAVFELLTTHQKALIAEKLVNGSSRVTATLGLTTFERLWQQEFLQKIQVSGASLKDASMYYNEVHRCIRNKTDQRIKTLITEYVNSAGMVCYFAETYGQMLTNSYKFGTDVSVRDFWNYSYYSVFRKRCEDRNKLVSQTRELVRDHG